MIESLLEGMHALPPELVKAGLLVFAFGSLLLMLRIFGSIGITAYVCIAIVAANLHVLKAVQFSAFPDPVALGTILFATTFLGTDILTEYYGPEHARRTVLLGFSGLILMTAFMIFGIGIRPLSEAQATGDWQWALDNHRHLTAIFTPVPAILLAGLSAYMGSQILDIWIYQRIRKFSHNRHLWLRNNASTWISALIDNTIFSLLAWVILAPSPLPLPVVWKTYILGTWFLRVGVALLDTPILYLAAFALPKEDRIRYRQSISAYES